MTIYEIISLAINLAILILSLLSYLNNKEKKNQHHPSNGWFALSL